MKKQLFSVLALGGAVAFGLTACGGGDGSPGEQAPTGYEISLQVDRTELPVNIGGEGPSIGAYAPYTTTAYVSATERGRPVPESTPFTCNVISGLDSGVLYYLNGEDETDDLGRLQASRSVVLESNSGAASFHIHALNRVGRVEVRCTVTDAMGNAHVATETISVGSGGSGHAGLPASVVYQAYSLDPKNPNVFPNPGNPNAPGIGYLGTQANPFNIPNSLGLQADVRDEMGQAVADPAQANVQVRILRNSDAAQGARLLANPNGDVVHARTNGGIADFRIASGPNRGAILLELTVDRFDNDVTNGIQDPIRQLLSVPVVHGISEEPLRMMPAAMLEATLGEEIEPVALEAEGGTLPYEWSASDLPEGLTLTGSGILHGNPSADPGTHVVDVQVVDRLGDSDQGTITIVLEVAPLEIEADMPSSVKVGDSLTFAVKATGGLAPYEWELVGAPGWLSIDAATGIISGTPGAGDVGAQSFVIQVTDDLGNVETANVSITVEAETP